MTQMVAIGGEVGKVNLIGNHECSNTPPSLFNEDETMRAAGTNASPVKVLREERGVRAVPNLPQQNLKTAVVVDAMYAVRRWFFHKMKPSAQPQSATGTICRLTYRLAQTAYISVTTGTLT